jgi:crotonobetainyl-CoA:carnitine CoA-transferase CaiB-like acyl-CoA transferase
LASKCDVIMENFSAGVLSRWGIDRKSMAETNPGLTVISMGGMGQTGPWKDFVTFAPTIHAVTGLTYLTNPPGEHLHGYGFSLTDHLSGLMGAYAALAAIEHKRRTGRGLDIDLSQYELGMGLMAPAFLDYFANGTAPEPVGNRHPFGAYAPHGIYPCRGEDRWVAIAVKDDAEFDALAGVMGHPDLARDSRFASHEARVANQDDLDVLISGWTVDLDPYEAMHRCQLACIPAGAVQNAAGLAGEDQQNKARDFFGTMATGPWGDHGVDHFPALINGKRPPNYVGAAESGADTFDVLQEVLGLDADEIAGLAEAGALS